MVKVLPTITFLISLLFMIYVFKNFLNDVNVYDFGHMSAEARRDCQTLWHWSRMLWPALHGYSDLRSWPRAKICW